MTDRNQLSLKDLTLELLHHKIISGACILLCTALCALIGYHQLIDKEKLAEYNLRLEEYDKVIKDVEDSLSLTNQQVEEMQEYVDHSIFMLLDSQNIQTASVQYAVFTGSDLNSIFNALIYYINEGGLRDSVGDSYPDLDVKYWRDVISCATGGNVFSITVMHYDSEKAKAIMNVVKQKLQKQVSVISQVEGEFTLNEIGTSYYTKADVNIANAQIGHLNTLKGYITNRADFTNRLISSQQGKTSYIEDNMPILFGSGSSAAVITMALSLMIGLLSGLALPMAYFSVKHALQKQIRSEEDVEAFSLHIIGSCHTKDNYEQALERGLVELTYFKETCHLSAIFFNILSGHEWTKKIMDDYLSLLDTHHLPAKTGWQLQTDAAQLQEMIAATACILVVQIGKTTYPQLEKQIELCNVFHIKILGCILTA